MTQEYKLGTSFNKMYYNKLLPEHYSSVSIYVRSSDINRTLMSAQSVLLGLYPMGTGPVINNKDALPNSFQPVPIHTVSIKNESLLIPSYNKEEFKKLVKKYVIPTKQWQEKNKQYQEQYAGWSKATSLAINDLSDLISLGDNLKIREIHGISLPRGITQSDANTIISLGDWASVRVFNSPEIADYGSQELLRTIVKYLHDAINKGTSLKYVLFSAHEVTIMSLLTALRSPIDFVPPYASDLKILLLKGDEDNYRVGLSLNGENIQIPQCAKNGCTLDAFTKVVKVNQ